MSFGDFGDLDAVTVDMPRSPYYQDGIRIEDCDWEQATETITLHYCPPMGTSARSIACEITAKRFLLGLRGQPPILNGTLHLPINADESTWEYMSPSAGDDAITGSVVITLLKKLHREWPHILSKNEESTHDSL